MEIIAEYWDQPDLKSEFILFLNKIHHLDLTRWQNAGFWDSNYTPFSFVENGKIISNVCVYSIPALINGKEQRVAQISGVGTLPEYQRKGLNRELTDMATDWLKDQHPFTVLFSDDDATEFYRKCGFKALKEYSVRMELPGNCRTGQPKMKPLTSHDLGFIHKKVQQRTSVSQVFSSLCTQLTMFHILYTLADNLYLIPELDAIIAWKKQDEVLTIFDIISTDIPVINQLLPFLDLEGVSRIEFRFSPDQLNIPSFRYQELIGNNPFYAGDLISLSKLVFPFVFYA